MSTFWGETHRGLVLATVGIVGLTSLTGTAAASGANRAASGGNTITCELRAHNPHNSHHVRGTVNVVAEVICTAPVPAMSLAVQLYRNGAREDSRTYTATGKSKLSGNAASQTCTSGPYVGVAASVVQLPQGYTPQQLELTDSNEQPILCP